MKNILRIFTRDLKSIVTNWVALVIILGLMILPSLYAWFNISAGWDPYGNTKGIQVGIVNKDSGDSLGDKNINVGDQLIDKLKENTNLGWQFVSEEEGNKGVNTGEYYATIIIPEDFTKETLSIISHDIKRPTLIYKVNQKSNAIAPKITDKGVSTIKTEIDTTIVETVNGVLFKVLNETGVSLEEVRPKLVRLVNGIIEINNNMPEIENLINQAYDGVITAEDLTNKINANIPVIQETLDTSNSLLTDVSGYLQKAKEGVVDVAPVVKGDLEFVNETLGFADSVIGDLLNLDVNVNKDAILEALDGIIIKITDIKSKIDGMVKLLGPLGKLNPEIRNLIEELNNINYKLDDVITVIGDAKDKIINGEPIDKSKLENIKALIEANKAVVANILDNYDSKYVPEINKAIDQMTTITDNTLGLVSGAQDSIPKATDLLSKLIKGVDLGKEELEKIKADLPEFKEKLSSIAGKVEGLDDEEKINTLLSLLKNNWEETSTFLGSPVKIDEEVLYPIPNYGSAMSPFYSTLSLWVGALILVSLLTTNAHSMEDGKKLKTYEQYFGKFLTFAFIGICQALILSIGDMLILNCYVVNPALFVGISVFTSVVFITMVYTLVSIFGNVGKAISVILLVIQVAAAGGTFPVEVMSPFFQFVHPFLPFTYAISAMREAVGGVVVENLYRDITTLVIYAVVFIVVGILLKGPINKATKKLKDKLNDSGLIGH
ncbi:YhgE/Pip family protein [Clostridium sp.]|uniref:YhgE/Pip domain-containing protein n=1 Tax=Clostridium sp. TaxID=1506 RepID=UPI003F3BDFB4